MKRINIFIAGSKSLRTYREKLVLWANERNYAYRKAHENVRVNMYSFKEVGDDQDTYNKVITEESDVILFLVEGTIGDKTKEELAKAKKAFHKKHRPEIWVFIHNLDNNTMSYIEGAMGREYAVDFESADDLVNKVSTRVDSYIDHYALKGANSQGTSFKSLVFNKRNIAILLFLLCLLLGYGVGKYCSGSLSTIQNNDKPMLLFAGGGSVANFIEEQEGTQIPSLADYPNGYFVHLPTKSAWKMLVEEVVSLQDARRYYPICISATEATDEDFCSAQISQQMFVDSAIVVSCKLGEDSLAVYAQKDCEFLKRNPECLFSKHISVDKLRELVKSKEMNVFSTSFESGTRAGYCKVLGIENTDLNQYLAGQFSEFSAVSAVSKGDKSYLLLGSQYYTMKAIKNDAVKLTVQSEYAKPMMIYFMAYRKNQDIYWVPQETLDFLGHLKVHSLDNYVSSDGYIRIKNHEHVIYDESMLLEN